MTVRKTINGVTYELRKWAYTKHWKPWVVRLGGVIAKLSTSGGAEEGQPIAAASAGLLELVDEVFDPKLILELSDVCEQYTDIIYDDGRVLPLKDVLEVHMSEHHDDVLELVVEHLSHNFAGFFGMARAKVRALMQQQAQGKRQVSTK